jgi:hypothetical protein
VVHRYQALLNRKTQIKIGEEGHKIQSNKCLLSNKIDVKINQEEQLTHEVTQQKHTEAKTQKIANLEGFLTKKGWRSVAKGKERYSDLCRAARSVGALVILSQGRQGLKVPEMSRKIRNCYLNSTKMLNVTR